VRLLHSLARTHASFDDPNLVSRAGLTELVAEQVRPGGPCGVNAPVKIGCLVAGMTAGADSIDDMDLLRHGAMEVLFGGIRAPSTLGSHLRSHSRTLRQAMHAFRAKRGWASARRDTRRGQKRSG
jgi:hypothetical protein